MKNVVPVLVGVVIGIVLGIYLGPRLFVANGGGVSPPPTLPPTTLPAPICEATIKLTLKKNATTGVPEDIIVDPSHPVCVALTRPVNWDIGDPDVKLVKIEFKEELNQPKGPFPEDTTLINEDGTLINEHRGIYLRTKAAKVSSKPAAATGRFKYWVEWTTANGVFLKTPDPVVCVRD